MRRADIPAIYANDNYGSWQTNFKSLVRQCEQLGGVRAQMAQLPCPVADDLTILKPGHSAFYGSPLALLLQKMQAGIASWVGVHALVTPSVPACDAYHSGNAPACRCPDTTARTAGRGHKTRGIARLTGYPRMAVRAIENEMYPHEFCSHIASELGQIPKFSALEHHRFTRLR